MWAMIIFSIATVAMLMTAQTKAVKEYVNTNIQKNRIAKMQSDQIKSKIDKKSDKAIAYAAIYGTAPTEDAQLQKVSTLGAGTYKVDDRLLSKRAGAIISNRVETAREFENIKIKDKTLKLLPKIDTSFAQKSYDEARAGFGSLDHGSYAYHEAAKPHRIGQKIGQMAQQIVQHVESDIDTVTKSTTHTSPQKELESEYREFAKAMDGAEERLPKASSSYRRGSVKAISSQKSFGDFKSFGF